MIEWLVIIILSVVLILSVHIFRNMFKTLNNIHAQLADLYYLAENYDELVKQLNASETYYGDATIEAFVKMSNQLNDNLKSIQRLQQELSGEADAEEEDEA